MDYPCDQYVPSLDITRLLSYDTHLSVNDREYARGQGSKKGHAHDDAAVQVLDILGENSIAQLESWVARLGWCLVWVGRHS
jgi:hypothetical protein